MEKVLKNITSSLIGINSWNDTSLNQSVYSFQKDLMLQQKSYDKSVRKLASKYLYKLQKMQNKFQKSNTEASEITTFTSLRKIISTYFNVSQSLNNLDKTSLLNLRNRSTSNRKHYRNQMTLISNEEKEQSGLIRTLHDDVISKEADYKHAYEMATELIKQVRLQNEREDLLSDRNYSDFLTLQQHNENLKLKETFYLQALRKYNREVDYYNNIRTKSNLCNYKIFFEDLFLSMKDTINYHQDILRDQREIYNYLQNELKCILLSVNPVKDAQIIFNSVCSEINYESKMDEKLYKELTFDCIGGTDNLIKGDYKAHGIVINDEYLSQGDQCI